MVGTAVQLSPKRTGPEWPNSLSAEDVVAAGWRPIPIDEFVIKIHSRCNLACDYCYIYEMADESWRDQPGHMPQAVVEQTAVRIAEHARAHELTSVAIMLHGGEPLLLGAKRLHQLLETFDRIIAPSALPLFRMQTNGLLLTEEIMGVLDEFDVRVGVSLDGGRIANDRHRVRRNGVGSYHAVAERINALRNGPHQHLFFRILATIDLANDPLDVLESLRRFAPPSLDFLLPHGNWHTPPPGKDPLDRAATPYADWLIPIFDAWWTAEGDVPGIRLFESIIRLLHQQPGKFESVGLALVTLASVQTDGSYELVDTLKSTYDGASATGLNIFENEVDDLLVQPSIVARQLGAAGTSETCRRCSLGTVCGGGYYPHRYRAGSGFLEPSVYCTDLFKLITHIERAVA